MNSVDAQIRRIWWEPVGDARPCRYRKLCVSGNRRDGLFRLLDLDRAQLFVVDTQLAEELDVRRRGIDVSDVKYFVLSEPQHFQLSEIEELLRL